MVGKHIFVRCRDGRGNAGTWTAAMTEGIADKMVVGDRIEPRCNMDETFAQEALMRNPGNNVLRMYYATPDTLVISRTFWVTDRITEVQGRKGAYTTSYILTDEDIARFCTDYSGAFDEACFESYDALVARMPAEGTNKITINEANDIFAHHAPKADASILNCCNISKESFVALMSAIYDAMENGKQVAVLLPQALRTAWVESGDATAERLGQFILSRLPDFTRAHFGMVSHWNCQISDRIVGDMPLLFVHPRGDEDVAILKRAGAYIIDLDTGRFTTEVKQTAPNYFAFLWDCATQPERMEEFWAHGKSNYKRLLRGRPASASAMESIYLLRCIEEEHYRDIDKCHRTLRLAAHEFAGAGTKVPMAEAQLSELIDKLNLTAGPLDESTEAALRYLMASDTEKTKHQHQEYQILLGAVEAGTAKEETVSALCVELQKEGREANAYFLAYLREKVNLPVAKVTRQLTQLVSGLFAEVCQNRSSTTDAQLLQVLMELIETWTKDMIATAPDWQMQVASFVEAYVAYIKAETENAKGLKAAYAFFFLLFTKGNEQVREKCEKVLQKEEGRIYREDAARLNDGSSRFSVFATAFLECFPQMLQESAQVLSAGYDRLFRIAFNPDQNVSEAAMEVFSEVTEQALKKYESTAEELVQRIFAAEEKVLQDKAPSWRADDIERMTLWAEVRFLRLMNTYVPGEARLSLLADNISWQNRDIYPLLLAYAERATADARRYIYGVLQKKNMLEHLFVYALFRCDSADIPDGIAERLGWTQDHGKKLGKVFELSFFSNCDAAAERFKAWYNRELVNLFASTESALDQHARVMAEWQLLKTVGAGNQTLADIAWGIYSESVYQIYNRIERRDIVRLSESAIRDIVMLQTQLPTGASFANAEIFKLVWNVDSAIQGKNTVQLRELCEQYQANEEFSPLLQKRLEMHLSVKRCPCPLACRIYREVLATPAGSSISMENLLNGLDYGNLSALDRGILLADIILLVHNDGAAAEREIGRKAMVYLDRVATEDGQVLLGDKFFSVWKQIKMLGLDYTRGTPFVSKMNSIWSRYRLKFDLKMFAMCLIGFVVAAAGMWGLTMLCVKVTSAIVLFTVLPVVLLALLAASVLLMWTLLSDKRRR